MDQYYRDSLKTGGPKADKPKVARAPKQVVVNDFQFYPPRLAELQNKETDWHRKSINYQVPVREPEEGETLEQVEAEQKEEQERIDNAVPLSEEEIAEKETLVGEGFHDWQRRHFQSFIRALEKYGRDDMEKVVTDVADRTEDEVREYAAVFFERYKELKGKRQKVLYLLGMVVNHIVDWERIMDRIRAGEEKIKEQQDRIDALHRKIKATRFPLQELKIVYGQNKGKAYSDEEDRFLLVRMHHHGIDRDDCYELIKRDIGEWPLFR